MTGIKALDPIFQQVGTTRRFHRTIKLARTKNRLPLRYRAGLFDVSALKIVNVRGPDALSFLNYVLTSDVSKAKPGDSHISNIVNANGGLIDDVLVYVDGPGQYRVSHGGGAFEEVAEAHKGRFNVDVERDDDVHILSLQGPTALYQPAKRFTIAAGENLSDRSVTMIVRRRTPVAEKII